MPFTKVGPDKYKSESGKMYTKKQMRLYYATEGFTKPSKKFKPKKKKHNPGYKHKGIKSGIRSGNRYR